MSIFQFSELFFYPFNINVYHNYSIPLSYMMVNVQ